MFFLSQKDFFFRRWQSSSGKDEKLPKQSKTKKSLKVTALLSFLSFMARLNYKSEKDFINLGQL